MNIVTVSLVAVALGTDALSMAIGLGLAGIRRKKALQIIIAIAIFHVIMPLLGLSIGSIFGRLLGKVANVIGSIVLAFIGGHMIWEAVKGDADAGFGKYNSGQGNIHVMTGITGLIILAGSVSLDALTVGFGLGTLKVNLWLTVLIMGLTAGIMTLLGLYLGSHLGKWLGEKAQLLGGIVLIGIGIKMLLT